jgi:hypothetical protein
MKCEPGASWRMVYSGVNLEPDHEEFRCKECTTKYGIPPGQHGIRPEFASGMFRE